MPFHYPDDSAESASPVPGPLKPYDVVIHGTATTLLLSDEDAKRDGLYVEAEPVVEPEPTPEKAAPAPPNKARFGLLNKKG